MSNNDDGSAQSANTSPNGIAVTQRILSKLFSACAHDPKGSVHRSWGISLIFVVMYFVLATIEMVQLQKIGSSLALVMASIWTGLVHLVLAVLGTFVLKRFPTSFSVGFILGILVVLANQNLILFATFQGYSSGSPSTNMFAASAFLLSIVLTFFSLLLFQFKKDVVVAPVDIKGVGGTPGNAAAPDYQSYNDNA